MSKKITITLSDEAEQYLAEVMYSLTDENDKPCTQSMAISESLVTLAMFEKATDNQIRNWLDDFTKLTGDAKEFAANPIQKTDSGGAERKTAEGWISVKDVLPKNAQAVYFYSPVYRKLFEGKFYQYDSFKRPNVFISIDGGHLILESVSHWMIKELPSPPDTAAQSKKEAGREEGEK